MSESLLCVSLRGYPYVHTVPLTLHLFDKTCKIYLLYSCCLFISLLMNEL